MSSFFQRARDRAQGAAAQLSSSSQSHSSTYGHHSTSSSIDGTEGYAATTTGGAGSTSSSSGFTYKGGLPHVFRAGLASVDPRFEATRSLHVMRGSLKGVVIDELALSRETKTAAAKVFRWGSDHKADGSRLDGAGDDVLVDLSDRLAFLLSTMGDLEAEHSERLSRARAQLKEVQTAELELAGKRAQRVKLIKELQTLVAERVVVSGGPTKADQVHAQLDQLQQDAKSEEEALSRLKRQNLQACFDAQFDSYIAHGEKMALVASYGKLLMQQVPVDEVAPFPAQHHSSSQGKWAGSAKTAQIRALVEPALRAYVRRTPIPTLSYQLSDPQSNSTGLEEATTQSDAASFLSFETTHARELAQDEEQGYPSAAEEKQRAAHRTAYTPMSSLPEHGKAADPPALPPRHTGDSTASGPPLPPRHTGGATTDVIPPLLATGGSLHHPSSSAGSVASQPPPVPARSDVGSVSTHRVPPPLAASSTTALNYWDPSFLESRSAGFEKTTGAPYAVVLLNQVIADHQKELFKTIWSGARVRICADGGANKLLSTFGPELSSTLPMPNAIVGDFDSLTPSSRSYFQSANVHLAHRPSQYATDLGKSIQWLEDWERTHEQLELVIFGGLSGRMDQTAHTLHVLWKLCPALSSVGGYEDPGVDATSEEGQRGGKLEKRSKTWVVGDESLVYLVPAGVHKLRHPRPALGVCCGILPLGVEASGNEVGARVKTQGLEWDLDPSQPQSMGGYLSTSNHVLGTDSSEVTIETDKPIYWSIEFGSSSSSASASASMTALQQARGGEKAGAGAALGGAPAAAAGPYSPSDPFADQAITSSSLSQGRRDSRTTPYLSTRDSDRNPEPVESLGEDLAPPGPTVAETGEVIPSSPSGPGPLSGTLQPRRRSSAYRGGAGSAISPGISPNQGYLGTGTAGATAGGAGALPLSPSLPARPPTQRLPSDYSTGAGAEGQGQGPVGNTTPAYLPPPHASPLTGSAAAGGRPEVLRVPSADFVSRGSGGGGGGQGYGAGYGAAPPLGSGSGAGGSSMTAMEMEAGPVPGGFPSSSYPSSTNTTATASEARSSNGDGAAGGAGGVGLALAAGISHHQSGGTDTSAAPGSHTGAGGVSSGIGGGVRARIRRDGTITRRGVDSDFDQAESEQLPPYTEM